MLLMNASRLRDQFVALHWLDVTYRTNRFEVIRMQVSNRRSRVTENL